MSDSTTSGGPGALTLLGVLFVALKLTGYIGWSWWWVTLPFWGGLAFALIILLAAGSVIITADAISTSRRRKTIKKRRY